MGAEIGMLVVETIAKIRRAYFVHGQPIKAICRDLGVSRKVVRKVIRSEATEFRYEREAQPLPRIGPWSDKLDHLLVANEGKASRERLTLSRSSGWLAAGMRAFSVSRFDNYDPRSRSSQPTRSEPRWASSRTGRGSRPVMTR